MLYFADAKWYGWHYDTLAFQMHRAERCTIYSTGHLIGDPSVHMLRNGGQQLMSDNPEALHTGYNSGYQAVNLAVLTGARRIVLAGYDAKPNSDGRRHFFGDHPDGTEAPYQHMISAFRNAVKWLDRAGVEVMNASPDSALVMFKKVGLQDVIT